MTAFAGAVALALIGLPRPGAAADAVVLQLQGPAQFEFAGYYAALWKGFYRDAGLAVEIHPGGFNGKTPVDPVRELAEGRAQFGTGNAQLVIRAAQGLPLLLVAPIFQGSGAAVYYRADSDFSSPAALMKAKLGRLPASDILDIELVTALRAEGIEVKDLGTGLVDFYAMKDGELVFLCWQHGEPAVSYFHTLTGGFRSRQPIEGPNRTAPARTQGSP